MNALSTKPVLEHAVSLLAGTPARNLTKTPRSRLSISSFALCRRFVTLAFSANPQQPHQHVTCFPELVAHSVSGHLPPIGIEWGAKEDSNDPESLRLNRLPSTSEGIAWERLERRGLAFILDYLESSNPRNIPFYERLGFERLGAIQAGTFPQIVPMLRKPR